jgi:hypothetical protein
MTVINTSDQVTLEAWRNATRGRVIIQRLGPLGQLVGEIVRGGAVVHITKQERDINESRAIPELNVFRNGVLMPIDLPDTPETAELQANANVMNDAAMRSLFKMKLETFQKRIQQITAPWVLESILTVGREVDCSVKQEQAIKERLAQLGGGGGAADVTPQPQGEPIGSGMPSGPGQSRQSRRGDGPRPVTPQ